MEPANIFKRHEIKFVLSQEKYHSIHETVTRHAPPDVHGEYLVQSIYFDTPNWDVIRASIEKPVYKEKLRLRCYNVPSMNSAVFLELKKKYKGIVNKRRILFPLEELRSKTARDMAAADNSQIGQEIDFYLRANPVHEKAHVSYKRMAFAENGGLRITFDTDIRFRTDLLDYEHPKGGPAILPDDLTVMEVKTLGGMPLWLVEALSKLDIRSTSFSKYGVGYKKYVLQKGDVDTWTF